MSDESDILNLVHLYAEYLDTGQPDLAADLFEHATVKIFDGEGGVIDSAGLREFWTNMVIVYPDGTPRTKHIVTNPILEVDATMGTATCRTYYTVFQQAEGFALQPIVSGRYADEFSKVDGRWRFSHRNYSMMDFVGDTSHHLSQGI